MDGSNRCEADDSDVSCCFRLMTVHEFAALDFYDDLQAEIQFAE